MMAVWACMGKLRLRPTRARGPCCLPSSPGC